MGFIRYKVPGYLLLICAVVFLCIGWMLKHPSSPAIAAEMKVQESVPGIESLRKKDGRLIQPLIMVDFRAEDPSLAPLKSTLEQYLKKKELAGDLKNASVYFRDLNSSKNFSMNPSAQYLPA